MSTNWCATPFGASGVSLDSPESPDYEYTGPDPSHPTNFLSYESSKFKDQRSLAYYGKCVRMQFKS